MNEIAVNTHHLPEQIAEFIAQLRLNWRPYISHEPILLGSGGAIPALENWRSGDELIVLNGDSVCNIDLAKVVAHHVANKAAATFVVREGTPTTKNPVVVWDGQLVAVPKTVAVVSDKSLVKKGERRDFCGIQVLSNHFISGLPSSGPCEIWPGYAQLMSRDHPVSIYEHQGFWADVGDPVSYFAAHEAVWLLGQVQPLLPALGQMGFADSALRHDELLNRFLSKKLFFGNRVSVNVSRIQTSGLVLGFESSIFENGTTVSDCIAFGQARLRRDENYRRKVVYTDVSSQI